MTSASPADMDEFSYGFSWAQGPEEDSKKLEIRANLILPEGCRVRDIEVLVKETDIICVKFKEAVLLQWRLHDDISSEDMSWELLGSTITIELLKKEGSQWPALRNQPLEKNSKLLLSTEELDKLLQSELKSLPTLEDEQKKKDELAEPAKTADLDDILDEALDEAKVTEEEEEKLPLTDRMVKAELEALAKEMKGLNAAIDAEQEKLSKPDISAEDKKQSDYKLDILLKMKEIAVASRQLRTETVSCANFLEILDYDLKKALLNSGNSAGEEREEFASEEEKAMSGTELVTAAIQCLQAGNMPQAFHLLRVNALHNNHSVSVCLLHRLYMEREQFAKAGFFVRHRSKADPTDAPANLLVAEMFDRGVRHFPPLFAMAVMHFQNGAKEGNVHAMLSLAQLFRTGGTSATSATETNNKSNVDIARSEGWLGAAIERGSASAYFVKCCVHLTGGSDEDKALPNAKEADTRKSYRMAKYWMDRVSECQPGLLRRAQGLDNRLEELRKEEEGGTSSKPAPSTAPASKPVSKPSAATRAVDFTGEDDVPDVHPPRPSGKIATRPAGKPSARDAESRLNKIAKASTNPNAFTDTESSKQGMMKKAAAKKNNWGPFFERLTKFGAGSYFIYALAFPLRIAIAPYFFSWLAMIMESVGIQPAAQEHPGMGMMM